MRCTARGLLTQEDPIGIAGGLNLYGYANGDPINFSDPFGLCVEDDDVCSTLVGLLRGIGGDALNRAADAFDAYQGGTFQLVDRETLDRNGAVNAAVQRNGDVFFANDLLKGDLAVTAVHESRHLPTDVSGGFGHGQIPERYFYDVEYQAYQSLPNPGPYAATRSFFRLRNSYPGLQLIRPLPPGR